MIRRPIDTPDALHRARLYLAERVQIEYIRLEHPDRYHIKVCYQDQVIEFENACLESGYPEPTPYGVISWLHTWCIYALRNTKEEYGEKWHVTGKELDEQWNALQKRKDDAVKMFGTGFATDWNTRW